MNKFDRVNFLCKTGDGLEWDLLINNWDLFEIHYPLKFDTVIVTDIQRPDVLSIRIYGSDKYWWILCKFNHIDDVWNDLYIGMDLVVPDIRDIHDFYASVRRRNRHR